MQIGRIPAFFPGKVAVQQTAAADQRARTVEPASAPAAEREAGPRPAANRVVEGELLQGSRGFRQSTQAFLEGRGFVNGASPGQDAPGNAVSASARQALGQYLDNVRPEPRQYFTQGRSIDEIV